MLSIVYSSAATRRFERDDLVALLQQSRESNAAGITGVLAYRDGRFLQVLEGPSEAVLDRMRVIEADERHGQVRVLLEDEVDERWFPDWSMGFEGDLDEDVPGFRRTFDDIDADRATSGSLPAVRALLGWFRERHDR